MERVTARAVEAGYRSDWRGRLGYLATPEAWTTRMYTVFVMAVGGLLCALTLDAATGGDPIVNVPLKALMGYWFVVRPTLRVAERRATAEGGLDSI